MHLEGQGVGYVQRKLVMSVAVTHTITMDPPHLTAFRLQVSCQAELYVFNL
jgi:hypothetical protein